MAASDKDDDRSEGAGNMKCQPRDTCMWYDSLQSIMMDYSICYSINNIYLLFAQYCSVSINGSVTSQAWGLNQNISPHVTHHARGLNKDIVIFLKYQKKK
jgi:hypothetical protein